MRKHLSGKVADHELLEMRSIFEQLREHRPAVLLSRPAPGECALDPQDGDSAQECFAAREGIARRHQSVLVYDCECGETILVCD